LIVGREHKHLPSLLPAVASAFADAGEIMPVWLDPVEHPDFLEIYKIEKELLPVVVYADVSGGAGTIAMRLQKLPADADAATLATGAKECFGPLSKACDAKSVCVAPPGPLYRCRTLLTPPPPPPGTRASSRARATLT
jgi:hypothetical protein